MNFWKSATVLFTDINELVIRTSDSLSIYMRKICFVWMCMNVDALCVYIKMYMSFCKSIKLLWSLAK